MLILVIVLVIFTILLFSSAIASSVENKDRELVKLLTITAIVSTFLSFPATCLYVDGVAKGIKIDPRISITSFIQEYGSLPYDESEKLYNSLQNSENLDGRYVVFYRADCDDCLNELPKYHRLFNSDKVYFVCTTTEYGSRLKRTNSVHWVPSVYEIKDGRLTLIGDEKESISELSNLN